MGKHQRHQSSSEGFSRHDSANNKAPGDPTTEWFVNNHKNAGVHRGRAYAGTHERLRQAEARGEAERGDHSGASSGEKSERHLKLSSSSSNNKTSTNPLAKLQALARKDFLKKHTKAKVTREKSKGGSKRGNDGAGNKKTATAKSASGSIQKKKPKAPSSNRGHGKPKDLVAAVADRTTKTASRRSKTSSKTSRTSKNNFRQFTQKANL